MKRWKSCASKKKGNYNIVQIDPATAPTPSNANRFTASPLSRAETSSRSIRTCSNNVVTENKDLPDEANRDLIVALITLKYTQSNSVCYVKDGQAIGVGAGQQSRVHCTRLAGNKADNWYLRQNPKVLALPFKKGIRRADRDNTIDVYISDDYMDVLADGTWENFFEVKPEPLTREEKRAWLDTMTGVSLGSRRLLPVRRQHRACA